MTAMEDALHIDLKNDGIRGGDDVDRRRSVRKTGESFAEKESLPEFATRYCGAPIIFLDDMN